MKQGILFVDDMEEVYNKVRECLGEIIDYASTKKEALKKISERNYSLIITDYDLNGSSHNEGLEIIKSASKKGLTSMLISRENHKTEALEAGADGFMFKKDFLTIIEQDE